MHYKAFPDNVGTYIDHLARLGVRYNGTTGHFYRVDKLMGGLNAYGYRRFQVTGRKWLEHVLVWYLHYGKIPKGYELDHINGDRSDNRLDNLRLVTRSENSMNSKIFSNSKLGSRGVCLCLKSGKYKASITKNYKAHHLGTFDTKERSQGGTSSRRVSLVWRVPEGGLIWELMQKYILSWISTGPKVTLRISLRYLWNLSG